MVKKKLSFEENLAQLEEIVSKLEEGDIPLEEAINYFKEGMDLSKSCHSILKNVEEQMSLILDEDGELRPFEMEGAE